MTLTIEVIAAVLVILLASIVVLRILKLRGDDQRSELAKPNRLVTPPPSPYATSKGFRLVRDTSTPSDEEKRAAPPRPRLEPAREYVFGESQVTPYDPDTLSQLRHDEQWALARSARRASVTPHSVRRAAVAVVVVVVLAVGAFYVFHHTRPKATPPTSTTTTVKLGAPTSDRTGVAQSSFVVISLNTNANTWASSRHAS